MNPPPRLTEAWNRLEALSRAFQQSRILLTGIELDVFSTLSDGPLTAAEVAAGAEADERGMERLLAALCALGLVERDGDGRYRNATESGALLVPDSPDYMAGLGHRLRLWDAWSTLTDAVRAGGTVMDRGVTAQDEQGVRAFIEAMHYRARDHALAVVRAMELDDVEHVLDVGGGSGVYAMAFARVHEGARATVFDLPQVVEITREYVRKEGLEDRVETLAGDYTRDDLGTGFDLVFLSAIVHSNGDEENRQLMRRCASALRSGGQIVIQDFVMTPGRTEPARGALFALNMLVNTPNGDTYTQAEIASWLEAAGFGDIRQSDLPGGVTQIIGRLPRVRDS